MNRSKPILLGAAMLTGLMVAAPAVAHRDYAGPRHLPPAQCPEMGEWGKMHGPGMYGHGPGRDGHGPFSEQRLERLEDLPDLDTEQRKAIRAIVDDARPRLRELSDTLRHNGRAMHDMMHGGAYDRAAFAALAAAQGEAIGKVIALRGDVHAQVRAVLREDQRETLRRHRW